MTDELRTNDDCALPHVVADRFLMTDKSFPYPIPGVWIDCVVKWTHILAELDPNFTYSQIKLKFGYSRVYANGDFRAYKGEDHALRAMEKELDALTIPVRQEVRLGFGK